MKPFLVITLTICYALLISCDVRSDTAKKEMEKFSGTPRPSVSPAPTPEPIDPADAVQVDTTATGELLSFNGYELKKSFNCAKYNSVRVNGDQNVVKVTGTCKQVMINGDKNEVTLDAASEFVFNGTGNTLQHSRFPNGKRPVITENQQGNKIEKVPFQGTKSGSK